MIRSGGEHFWKRDNGGHLFRDLPPGVAERAIAEHVERYLKLARQRRHVIDRPVQTPEDLYLVDADDDTVFEIVGLRLRGHPLAVLGAVRFPRHVNASVTYGRAALSAFFSTPPAPTATTEAMPPHGAIELFLPRMRETIPEMVERLRRDRPPHGVHVDVSLIDLAFDLRFVNPSAIPLNVKVEEPQRRLFRTTRGHLLSGISVGFYRTVQKGLQFVTLTDAFQHRPGNEHLLPTLALNRRILVMEARAGRESSLDATDTLTFHPSTANPKHILGWAYDDLEQPGQPPAFEDVAVDQL